MGSGGDTPLPILNGHDNRAGLNLTYRTLAAVLKYDNEIASTRDTEKPDVTKGYYYTERDLVRTIKRTMGVAANQQLRTIECSIMDVADDIAYSTYDIEDSFKARFLTPTSMLAMEHRILDAVASEVQARLKKAFSTAKTEDLLFGPEDVQVTLVGVFEGIFATEKQTIGEHHQDEWWKKLETAYTTTNAVSASNQMVESGYYRAQITSDLVGTFIKGIHLNFNEVNPYLSTVNLDISTFSTVEVLKNFAYQSLIMLPMLKVAEYRGKDIVTQIFRTLTADQGYRLMPSDFQELYRDLKDPSDRRRVVCDFIAGRQACRCCSPFSTPGGRPVAGLPAEAGIAMSAG
jgi:dGTPase